MSFTTSIAGLIGGGATGGPLGALAGLLGGSMGGGPSQSSTQRLRPLQANESRMWNGAIDGLANMGTGPYDPKIFNMLWNPAKDNIKRGYGKERGRTARRFASTGGGPSSVTNAAMSQLAGDEGRALAAGEAQVGQTAAGITNAQRSSLQGLYSAGLSGQQVGGGMDISFPQDNMSSSMAMIGQGLMNPNSWYNTSGKGMMPSWLGGTKVSTPKTDEKKA
jgi:hypothetical protein